MHRRYRLAKIRSFFFIRCRISKTSVLRMTVIKTSMKYWSCQLNSSIHHKEHPSTETSYCLLLERALIIHVQVSYISSTTRHCSKRLYRSCDVADNLLNSPCQIQLNTKTWGKGNAQMSKLSPALKALIAAAHAKPNTIPAPPQIRRVYEQLWKDAQSKNVGTPAWLTMSVCRKLLFEIWECRRWGWREKMWWDIKLIVRTDGSDDDYELSRVIGGVV